ncbi:hypothetical protein [Mycolicibacterium mengxianglii]|uniref:hypothetical protein n=1 Tax=Mycolicibacterium mengxianglii TaxID=2736649 RepID=UPI0018CFFC10|nr:hypothetical protein [Mycolicibacterium mengxianglii]
MRIVLPIAALMLVAGCSAGGGDSAGDREISSSTAPSTDSGPASSAPSTPPGRVAGPPPADAPVAAVIAWVQGGTPADLGGFHSSRRDEDVTDLGDDVAFVTPAGTQCRTDATRTGGALACLVELADPPAQPADVYGQWVGNWVDFAGAGAQVGSAHGDPGPFTTGTGPELAYGSSLRFGDYQCRADPVGLFCVNFARQTGLRMSDAGVVPFGCLQEIAPPADAGIRFECT